MLVGLVLALAATEAVPEAQSWTVQPATAEAWPAQAPVEVRAYAPAPEAPITVAQRTARLNSGAEARFEPDARFGGPVGFAAPAPTRTMTDDERWRSGWVASTRQDIWREGDGYAERLSVSTRGQARRADGAPLPPTGLDAASYAADSYDVSYTRGWTLAQGRTASGLEVSLTPHAGVGVENGRSRTEAGATLRVGRTLDNIAPDGREAFGERARWYVYAAGSGRAVGYNFARNRDGDYARSGMSHDSGNFLGDASVGVAYRRGAMQTSVGVVYREIEAEGLRGGRGLDKDVSEGLVAFQLSIKPD